MNTLINEKFKALAESDYKDFNRKLIPTNYEILGIRMPALRKLAKEIAADCNVSLYLNNAEFTTYEHIILYGLVLGYLKETSLEETSLEERSLNERSLDERSLDERSLNERLLDIVFKYLDPLILKFDNWAHVDTIISSFKIFKKYPNEVLAHFLPLKNHDGEFTKRTFVVLLMDYFMDETHIEATLQHFTEIKQGQYYVDMAIAWALCEGIIKHQNKTIALLQQNLSAHQNISKNQIIFSKFVHNKAIQKARESFRVLSSIKEQLNKMKVFSVSLIP